MHRTTIYTTSASPFDPSNADYGPSPPMLSKATSSVSETDPEDNFPATPDFNYSCSVYDPVPGVSREAVVTCPVGIHAPRLCQEYIILSHLSSRLAANPQVHTDWHWLILKLFTFQKRSQRGSGLLLNLSYKMTRCVRDTS